MNVVYRTITEATKALQSGETSARVLTEQALTAIDAQDEQLHAFLHVDRDGALKAADESDARREDGKTIGPLDGIPISIKDVIVTTGMPTTAADKILEHYQSPFDATVVARLKAAGIVILGKNNCDAWAHGSSTENSAYGPSRNPWDTERVPGGSSGGSAVAVAAGMGLASIGTDTGGSIRQPAAFTGVTGFKPTYGRLSRYGLIAMASSLDCPGPLARSAEDCALLFDVMKGQDPLDATSLPDTETTHNSQLTTHKPFVGKKIGIPKEYFGEGLDPEVKRVVLEALAEFERLGATLVDIDLPMTKYGIAAYYIIMPAEVSSNLGRMDGIRFGKSEMRNLKSETNSNTEQPQIRNADDLIRANRSAGFGPEAKRRIMLGTHVLSSGYYDAYYKRAMQVRTKLINEFKSAFERVDFIAGPTTPTPAFKLGAHTADPLAMYLEDVYTVTANLAGIPGISIPVGFAVVEDVENPPQPSFAKGGGDQTPLFRKEGQGEILSGVKGQMSKVKLPVGLQLLGPQRGDEDVLSAAMAYQKVTSWHLEEPV